MMMIMMHYNLYPMFHQKNEYVLLTLLGKAWTVSSTRASRTSVHTGSFLETKVRIPTGI